jgi:hypothetical protein
MDFLPFLLAKIQFFSYICKQIMIKTMKKRLFTLAAGLCVIAMHAQQLRNPIAQNYVPAGKGWRLTAHSSLTENQQPTFLGYRQESPHIVMETEIDTDQLDFDYSEK